MRRHIARAANSLLAPLGARIVRAGESLDVTLDMHAAVQRVAEHGIPVRTVLDVGASDGKWSVGAMSTFPTAAFLAVEPLQERGQALETLKRKHGGFFDYVLCAAGEEDGGQVHLWVTDDLDGSTVGGAGRSVPVRTVDAIVAERGLEGPFLLKLDTHGYEVPILAGARKTLDSTNVLIIEVYNFRVSDHSLRFHEMCSHVERLGFRSYDIASPMLRPRDKAFWQMDLLFARNDDGVFACSEYAVDRVATEQPRTGSRLANG